MAPASIACGRTSAGLDGVQIGTYSPPPRHEIVISLEPEKEAVRQPKIPGESQVRIGGDGALAQNDFIEAARRHMQRPREPILSEGEPFQKLFEQDFAGRGFGNSSGLAELSRLGGLKVANTLRKL